jgi:hypothetical protein
MWEWLWWTGLITFSLIIESPLRVRLLPRPDDVDHRACLRRSVWIRFLRFPPLLAAYEQRMAERYFTSRSTPTPTPLDQEAPRPASPGRQQRRRR